MKAGKYSLVLAGLVAVFCGFTFGKIEFEQGYDRGLLGWPNPTLVGIGQLYVVVELADGEPNKDGLARAVLEKLVRDKLKKEGGIAIAEDDLDKMESDSLKKLAELLKKKKKRGHTVENLKWRSADIPELRVDIDMLKLGGSQQYVFHIQTSLARTVVLPTQRNLHIKTGVWEAEPVMEMISIESMPDKVTDKVLEQVETFISCYLVANANDVQRTDANYVGTAPNEQVKPTAEPAKARYNYIASKKSAVFHKSGCRWAERISPENLVGYNTREEAIRAGKRPCKRCKP